MAPTILVVSNTLLSSIRIAIPVIKVQSQVALYKLVETAQLLDIVIPVIKAIVNEKVGGPECKDVKGHDAVGVVVYNILNPSLQRRPIKSGCHLGTLHLAKGQCQGWAKIPPNFTITKKRPVFSRFNHTKQLGIPCLLLNLVPLCCRCPAFHPLTVSMAD